MVLFKDSGNFIKKIHKLDSIPANASFVIADVVALHPSIPNKVGLRALKEALDKSDQKATLTEKSLKMADFLLKKNSFEFGNKIKPQISGVTTDPQSIRSFSSVHKLSTFWI